MWDTSCKDWESRIKQGLPLVTCPVLYPDSAEYALSVFKQLRIVDMLGRPTIEEVTKEWIYDFAGVFFGSLDDEKNRRDIQEFFLLISKKNTKSTISAAIMMTVLILNVRESAEFIILAPTKDGADNAFKPAMDMIRADDELNDLFHVQDHIRTITHRTTRAKLKVAAADSDTVSGNKATGVLIDELWAFGKKAKASSMMTEATGGLMSRPEGFVMYLTTQSDDPPSGVFKEKLSYARNVRDGIINDPHFLPVLYEYPADMIKSKAYLNPDNYHITNPNLGASVDKSFLNRKIRSAQEGGDETIQQVLAKHLNVEIGLALRSDRWAGADYWAQTGADITLDYIIENCEVIDIGIDGGGLDDLLGLSVVGRVIGGKEWLCWSYAWGHPSVLERRKQIAPRLKDFQREGSLTIVDYVGEDVRQVADIVERVDKANLLDKIGVDPIGIGAILDEIEERDIMKDKIVGISQGWKLGGAIKTCERRLAEGTMTHDNSGMMSWCVSNARIEDRANSILITKQASGKSKIDPLMAVLNAVSLMSMNPDSMKEKFQFMVI